MGGSSRFTNDDQWWSLDEMITDDNEIMMESVERKEENFDR